MAPVNSYFQSFNTGVASEQDLYEDLIIESIQIYGFETYYLPRHIVEEDDLLNEEISSKFDKAYQMEMYLQELDGFEGEDILSKFGYQTNDSCTLVIAKRRWDTLGPGDAYDPKQTRPLEGDLVYIPFSDTMFEIRFVEDQKPFFQLNDLPVYQLQCDLFDYESQDFDTGISDIDDIEGNWADASNVFVTITSGTFTAGEKVTMVTGAGVTIKAEYTKTIASDSGTIFSLTDITYPAGEFVPLSSGSSITGDESGAAGVVGTVIGLDNSEYDSTSNDKYQDNSTFENAGIDFLDFSEDNPFGEL
jgi:hypothetical protein